MLRRLLPQDFLLAIFVLALAAATVAMKLPLPPVSSRQASGVQLDPALGTPLPKQISLPRLPAVLFMHGACSSCSVAQTSPSTPWSGMGIVHVFEPNAETDQVSILKSQGEMVIFAEHEVFEALNSAGMDRLVSFNANAKLAYIQPLSSVGKPERSYNDAFSAAKN